MDPDYSHAMVWLGSERGALTDWMTQQWVRLTGRRIDLTRERWLEGPAGKTTGIGADFFHELAREHGLEIDDSEETRGLIRFDALRGPRFEPARVDSRVKYMRRMGVSGRDMYAP